MFLLIRFRERMTFGIVTETFQASYCKCSSGRNFSMPLSVCPSWEPLSAVLIFAPGE